MALSPNTRLGRYEIRSKLGEGRMGEVYLALDAKLGRRVALKVLPPEVAADQRRMRRFIQEAQAASALNHPNIITIYEIEEADSTRFIATEFVEGETLRGRMRRARMPLAEVLDIAVQIADALSAAHAAKIIHRDIKPENVMVRSDGYVKVLDFGLAKLTERPDAADAEAPTRALVNTERGVVMGTAGYMSPEQARGLETDGRTDIWSLGVVLYEMLAGRAPFAGETATDVITAIVKTRPAPLSRLAPEVPPRLEEIVSKALEKERGERYQGIGDLLVDLRRLQKRLDFEAELERARDTPKAAARGEQTEAARQTLARPATTGDAPPAKATEPARETSGSGGAANFFGRRGVPFAVGVIVLLLAAAGAAYWLVKRPSAVVAPTESIAVLPFVNEGNDPDFDYLSDGISESLINNLSQLPGLKVIARSSSFKFRGKDVDPREAARALGVQAVVMGRVVERGDRLQISAELVNAREGTEMWGQQYTRRAADLLSVQGEIAREIADNLRLRLAKGDEQRLSKQESTNPEAYQLFLKGRFFMNKGTGEGFQTAADYFNRAITLDPNFALAYAEMGRSYIHTIYAGGGDPRELLPKAEAAAARASALDANLSEAHYTMGQVAINSWRWVEAERECRRAVELNLNNALAHGGYATYLSFTGQHEQAVAEMKRARELDPLSLQRAANVALALIRARRYEEALADLQKTLELDQNFSWTRLYLGYAYTGEGRYPEAIAEFKKATGLGVVGTEYQLDIAYCFARMGRREQAETILKQVQTSGQYFSPVYAAELYVALGEREKALDALEQAYAAHDYELRELGVDAAFDSLRRDARFQDLLRRVGLTP